MKNVSRVALAATASLAGATLLAATPAAAQVQAQVAQAQPPQAQRTFSLTRAEQRALEPLHLAVEQRNFAAAQAALPAARAGAQSAEARYILGQSMLRWALDSQNVQLQAQAIEAIIASGAADASEMPLLLQSQGALALGAGDRQRAEAAYARAVQLNPNDANAMVMLAEIRSELRRPQETVALFRRALQVSEASGRRAPESWYLRAVRAAFDNRMVPETLAISRGLLANYPSPIHWRDALLMYRDLSPPDEQMRVDHYRLMRASGALAGERDYLEAATFLHERGLSAEASALLQEGVTARQVSPTEGAFRALIATTGTAATRARASLDSGAATARSGTTAQPALTAADALFGAGRYADAAELYRAALQRGGLDAGLVNTRLGAALALAGQRAEAEAALRAVTGPRAELAQFWLTWLARRPA